MKTCIKCKIIKSIEEFRKDRNSCKLCHNAQSKIWKLNHPGYIAPVFKKDPEYRRRWDYRTRYGITLEEFESRLNQQNRRCGICLTDNPKGRRGRFVVDHCHKTGKIRGILCDSCNKGIGILGDTEEALNKALNYLKNIVDFQKENRKNKGKNK